MKRLILALCLLLPSAAWAQCFVSGDTTKYTHFIAVDAIDQVTRETGLTSFTVSRSRNGGATADFTTPTVQEIDSTKHPGVYRLLLDEDMTIGSGSDMEQMVLTITHAGMVPVTKEICIARPKITTGQTLTVSGGNANAAVQSVAANAIDAAAIANGAIDRATFATDTNPLFGIVSAGTAQAADSDSLTLAANSPVKPGWTINVIGGSAGVGETCLVESATGSGTSTPVATCANGWAGGVTPTGTIGYVAYGSAPGVAGDGGGGASIEDIEELLPSNFGSLAISSSGIVQADVRQYGGSNGAFTSGAPTVRLSTGTGAGQISLSSGAVTAGTVSDKTGYSLSSSQTFSTTGSVGSVTGNVGGTVNGLTATAQGNVRTALGLASANLDTQLGAIAGYLDTEIAAILQDTGTTLDGKINAIQAIVDKLDDTLEDNSGTYRFTESALAQAPAGGGGGGGGTDWDADERTAIRAILGVPASGTTPADPSTGILDTIRDAVATRASQTSVDDLPTNAELASALAAADDAVLSAVGDVSSKLPALTGDGLVPVDVKRMNGAVVTGDGSEADPWDGE